MTATHARYRVVALMTGLGMITYLDRACIATLAPGISRDLALSTVQMGYVFTSFQLAYALFEIPTAWWADRQGTRSVLARIVIWWSCLTAATAAAFSYPVLVAIRFLFGMGEAGAWPCVARTFSRWIPISERGRVQGIFFAGAHLVGGLTPALVLWLLAYLSWHQIFVAFGAVGFVWVAVWHRWFRDDPTEHPAVNAAEREVILTDRPAEATHASGWAYWRHLLCQRNVVLLCLMYMPNCATFYFCITWLPTYLTQQHGFEKAALGFVASLPLFLSIATQFLGGYFSDCITARHGLRAGRRVPAAIGYSLAAVCITIAALSSEPKTAAVFIALAAATCMLTTAPAWGTCVDIGREHSAVVGAIMNTAGQIAAILSQPLIGYSVKWFENWNLPFFLLGGLFLMGALCWLFIDPHRPVFSTADPLDRGAPRQLFASGK
jgi:MFS family permease